MGGERVALACVDHMDKMDYIEGMTFDIEDSRRQARREVHVVLDALLPHLAYEEMVGLLGSLRTLATRPHVLSRAFSFASEIVRDQIVETPVVKHSVVPALALKGGGHGEILSKAEASKWLDAASEAVDPNLWAGSQLLSVGELEALLGVRRSTIHNWRSQRRIVGLRKGLRNFVYPALQFDGKCPVDGLADVIAAHPDAESAWEWLVAPNPATGWEPPLTSLRHGDRDGVLRAVNSQLDYA